MVYKNARGMKRDLNRTVMPASIKQKAPASMPYKIDAALKVFSSINVAAQAGGLRPSPSGERAGLHSYVMAIQAAMASRV